MMSGTEYTYDVFLSYPSILARKKAAGSSWVAQFHDELKLALDLKARTRTKPRIYFDAREVRSTSDHAEMLYHASRSRIFLALTGPAYQSAEWAPQELAAFLATNNDPARLVLAAVEPLAEDEIELDGLRGRTPVPFHTQPDRGISRPGARTAMMFDPTSPEFDVQIANIAQDIVDKLSKMQIVERAAEQRAVMSASPATDTAAQTARRTILIAQTTDDVAAQAANMRSALQPYCNEFNIALLPEDDYPQGGDAFCEAFREDLSKADLVVQLLGETFGRMPRDLPQGYTRFQTDAAVAAGVPLMQWHRPDLDTDGLEDADQRARWQGEHVRSETFASFRQAVIDWAKTPPAPPAVDAGNCTHRVFVNAERSDWDAAVACFESLDGICGVSLPLEGEDGQQSIQRDLHDRLVKSDSILIMNGTVTPLWVRQQLDLAIDKRKLAGRPLVGAVCTGPPKTKPSYNMKEPGIEDIICTDPDGATWQFDKVKEFVTRAAGFRA